LSIAPRLEAASFEKDRRVLQLRTNSSRFGPSRIHLIHEHNALPVSGKPGRLPKQAFEIDFLLRGASRPSERREFMTRLPRRTDERVKTKCRARHAQSPTVTLCLEKDALTAMKKRAHETITTPSTSHRAQLSPRA